MEVRNIGERTIPRLLVQQLAFSDDSIWQEYKRLHAFLTNVTQAFRRYDADRSGTLDEREVKTALRDAGFDLEEPAFQALFRSFDPDRYV